MNTESTTDAELLQEARDQITRLKNELAAERKKSSNIIRLMSEIGAASNELLRTILKISVDQKIDGQQLRNAVMETVSKQHKLYEEIQKTLVQP